jgi:hypothetical protein
MVRASSVNAVATRRWGSRAAPKFVVAAADVLRERVTTDDHASGPVAFESAHRPESRLQASVVGFDPVVRVLLRVVERGWEYLLDGRAERGRAVRHDLHWLAVRTEHRLEEPSRRSRVTFR